MSKSKTHRNSMNVENEANAIVIDKEKAQYTNMENSTSEKKRNKKMK